MPFVKLWKWYVKIRFKMKNNVQSNQVNPKCDNCYHIYQKQNKRIKKELTQED